MKKNYNGEEIPRSEYLWGNRFAGDGNISGLVRMQSSPGSTYFTFRIISAKSPKNSWIRKEVPPVDVVSAVEKATREQAENMIEEGLCADIGLD